MRETDLTDQPSPEENSDDAIQDNVQPDTEAEETTASPPSATLPENPPDEPEEAAQEITTNQEALVSKNEVQPAEAAPPPVKPSGPSTTYRPTTLAVGILLIALGVILVWPVFSGGYILIVEIIIAIIIAGIALSLLAYWLNTGRRARGAFFLAMLGLLWAGLTGVLLFDPAMAATSGNWPFYIVALGVALLITYVGDRQHDTQLIPPSLICIVAGLAALTVTRDMLPSQTLGFVQRAWPWLAALIVLGMLPMAIRRTSHQE